jgi:hypothetical protein
VFGRDEEVVHAGFLEQTHPSVRVAVLRKETVRVAGHQILRTVNEIVIHGFPAGCLAVALVTFPLHFRQVSLHLCFCLRLV